MGWILFNNATRQPLRLRPGSVLVGRAQNAQIRPSHQSVSRNHAEIIVDAPSGSVQNGTDMQQYAVYMLDHSSTGHTFVNGQPSGKGVKRPLKADDTVCFGVDPINFSLQWCPTVVSCSSRLPETELNQLVGLAQRAGIFLSYEWTSCCTHLLMEQLSITPKLLCCVIDGGIPIARSYLEALASSEVLSAAPDPVQHQPQAPSGADAAYSAELQNCIRGPRVRHDMLAGVWIVFASQQASDALGKALTSAGCIGQFICTTVAHAQSVTAKIAECKTRHWLPEEVWVVPNLEQAIASALSPALVGLNAKRYIAVPLQAMVVGLLRGEKDGVHNHSGASRIQLVGAATAETPKGFQETQREPKQAQASGVKYPAQVKEESFQQTQDQTAPPTLPRKKEEADEGTNAPAKRQRVEAPRPTTLSAGQFEATAVKTSNSQDPPKFDRQPSGMAPAVSSFVRAKSEPNALGGPLTIASDTGLKQEAKQLKAEAGAAAPATVASSLGAPPAGSQGSGMPKILSINFDTPLTQPKPEEHKQVVQDSLTKVEPKLEAAPAPVPQVQQGGSSSSSAAAPPASRTVEPVQAVSHPTGVWLPKKVVEDGKQEPFVLQVPGLGDRDLHSLRATAATGAAKLTPPRTGISISAQPAQAAAAAPSGERRSFKMFRKSLGQQRAEDVVLVPIAPWVERPGPGLGELFASHRMDSESQLPPL